MARVNVTITLYMSELIYDVQNKTYLTGRSRYSGTNDEEAANMKANDDDENLNQVMRSIGNAFAMLKTKLSEYLDLDQTTGNNILTDSDANLTVTLVMPSNYNQATVDTVSSGLHRYIVDMAVGDWFVITNKADASDYVSMAQGDLAAVREAINKRVRPERPEVSVGAAASDSSSD